MRIVRYENEARETCWGEVVDEGHARPLDGVISFEDLHRLLAGSTQQVAQNRPVLHRAGTRPTTEQIVRRLAPVAPPNIFAIGRNYAEHAKEMKSESRISEPLVFIKATTTVIGPGEPIVLPSSAPGEIDYEAELAIIIGRRAREVSEADALAYVFGFTCANDVSARDCQKGDKQWARAKSFDTFCPLGPEIMTADALDSSRLAIRSVLNGLVMQDGNTGDMIFSVPRLVSYLSHQFTLLPGTLILTGTPPGVGAARTPPVFLKDGDMISIEIEGIGRLTNRVQAAR
jgi:2-keto-4-pentenoate hydratase/2-oxohepta-3-ene-1,7-dioic acid hydratase in catechol pathway